ncbi:hypothetical protein EDD86DRAFT_249989 [Gorgonomyces haynaldii]|nr:hypothetical protein EDD86DRAFT_249989 [Gorgonomyces haynaldii]
MDMQRFHWPTTEGQSRQEFRTYRTQNYQSYRNIEGPVLQHPKFESNHNEKSEIMHFQLRNLIRATSKNCVYYSAAEVIKHWNPVTRDSEDVVDFLQVGSGDSRVCTLDAKENVLIAGGFSGDYVIKTPTELHQGILTHSQNGITNHMQLLRHRTGAFVCNISSNDGFLRIIDVHQMRTLHQFPTPWALNCTASSPDTHLCVCVGDSQESLVISTDTGETLHRMEGHVDYSFSYKTMRLYDTRNLNKTLHVQEGHMGAIRSLTFSESNILSCAEALDYVHLYDPVTTRSQTIDFFGEIAGTCFDLSGDYLWISIADGPVPCLLEFVRPNT